VTVTTRPDGGSPIPKKLASKFHVQHGREFTGQAQERAGEDTAEDMAIDAAIKRSIDEFGA
jgi:hypothetical protein